MLTYIKINGFKSFHNFEMSFTPLTVIAGTNASGKSNLFDALRLLTRLAEADIKTAFSEQRGNAGELFTQYGDDTYAPEMEFVVEMLVHRKVKDKWGREVELKNTRMRYKLAIGKKTGDLGIDALFVKHEHLEKIKTNDDQWAKTILPKDAKTFLQTTVRAGGSKEPFIQTIPKEGIPTIVLRQDLRQGNKKATPASTVAQTTLGSIDSVDFPHAFAAKEEMRSWRFLQLNPEDLREPTRQDVTLNDTMTQEGKYLAAALYRIKQADEYHLKEISRKLNSFLPNFTDVAVYDDKPNRQFLIKVRGEDGKEFSSRVLSEGTLRLLALCILEYDEKHTGLLCFEEPENGIHPFRIKAMAQLLKDLSADFSNGAESSLRQVIVNTHSPALVKEMFTWHNDNNVSVWLSRLVSLISDIDGKRIKMKITKTAEATKKFEHQMSFDVTSEQERKLTLAEIVEYLQTADAENVITVLKANQ